MKYVYQTLFVLGALSLLVVHAYLTRDPDFILRARFMPGSFELAFFLAELAVVLAGVSIGLALRLEAIARGDSLRFDWASLAIYGIIPLYLFFRYSTSGALWLGLGPKSPFEQLLGFLVGSGPNGTAFDSLERLWPAFAFWFGMAIPFSWKTERGLSA